MKNSKSKIVIGTAASIVMATVFGTVVALASKVKYRGVNPTQGVISQLGLIDSVAFKPSIAHFTNDYSTVKKTVLGDKTFNASSSEFADFASKFDFLTNNGRTVLSIPKKYQIVIQSFTAEDDKQRFRLSFYLKETLADGNVAQSATKVIYLSPVDAPKVALAQFSNIIDTNFANLTHNPLSHYSSSSVKPLGLTRSADFAEKLNKSQNVEELESHLKKFFDIESLKANVRLQTQGFGFAKGDLEEPFVFSFVKNPQNDKEYATNLNQDLQTVRLYMKVEFSEEAKAALGNYKNKNDSYVTAIDLKTKDGKTLFFDNQDLSKELDVNLLDASDYYVNPDSGSVDPLKEPEKLPKSLLTLSQRDSLRGSDQKLSKFSLFSYNVINFYKQMQELVAKPSAIKDIIDASLVRGLTFSFGKYDLLFDNLRQHIDYNFLVSNARIKQNSISKKLFIELPIKITLKSSVLGDSPEEAKPILEKTVSFKLENFRDQSIESALETLYPEVKKDLDEARKKQKRAKEIEQAKSQKDKENAATSNVNSFASYEEDGEDEEELQNPTNSPIQWDESLVNEIPLGLSALKPYTIPAGANSANLLSTYEINKLIKEKDYTGLVQLISNPTTYNVNFKLKSNIFDSEIKPPTDEQLAKASFSIDSTDAVVGGDIYSVSSSIFQNKASLYGYYRHLLSLEPKDAIAKLVQLGKQIGLEFEGYSDLPLNFNISDLKNVKIKTKFDNKTFTSSSDEDEKTNGDDKYSRYKLRLLDFNNYYTTDVENLHQGMSIFLPAKLEPIGDSSSSGSSASSTSKTWMDQIIEKMKNEGKENDSISLLPSRIWQTLIGDEKAQDDKEKIKNKILEHYKKAIKSTKEANFWENRADVGNNNKFPFNKDNFKAIETLQDLVFAFYSQAALANNWNQFQVSGAKPTIVFEEINPKDAPNKEDPSVVALKFHYAIGFADNAGKFVDDVIKSSSKTIYLKTSGRTKLQLEEIKKLDRTIQEAPLAIQNVILEQEKFGHLQTLAQTIYDAKNPKKPEEGPLKKDDLIWVDDKLPVEERPKVKPDIPTDWYKDKIAALEQGESPAAVSVNVSNFSQVSSSPYFASPFQDEGKPEKDDKEKEKEKDKFAQLKKDAELLKKKLEVLLGQEFIGYYNSLDPSSTFEIVNIEPETQDRYKVTFKLAKTITENNVESRVESDKTMTIIVQNRKGKTPEMAKNPEVGDTVWEKEYDPQNPLAASTPFTLSFKEDIPLEKDGKTISTNWLSNIPLVIYPQMLKLTKVVQAKKAKQITEKQNKRGEWQTAQHDEEPAGLINSNDYNILNPYHQKINLTLNKDINKNDKIKVENVTLKDSKTLTFNLRTVDIKRLINAPIMFSQDNPIEQPLAPFKFFEEQIFAEINPQIKAKDLNLHISKIKDNLNSKTIFIKPKYIVERTVGVPWRTGFDQYGDGSKEQIDITKEPSPRGTFQSNRDFLKYLDLKNTKYTKYVGLSFKVFDPAGQLTDLAKRKLTSDEVSLYSYKLNKTQEKQIDKIRKGWTNVHPSQSTEIRENLKVPLDYLNIIANQPWKVTLYNSSDFITNLFTDPEFQKNKPNKNHLKTIRRKINGNYADWGSAYFTLWYPQELIDHQTNVITANLTQLLFKSYDELQKNEKLIAPNLTQWWPNLQNSSNILIRTKLNEQAKKEIKVKNRQWNKLEKGGFALQALKTTFKRKSRKFSLTTNIPVPLQDYSEVDPEKQDWRFVFQNDNNQIAMLKAKKMSKKSDTENSKKGWIQFETTIPEHFFTSNVRFVGILKQEDDKAKWLPIINTSIIRDYRDVIDAVRDEKSLKSFTPPDNVVALALTNNAFNNVFKEFNIKKDKNW